MQTADSESWSNKNSHENIRQAFNIRTGHNFPRMQMEMDSNQIQQDKDENRKTSEKWKEFLENTTLHGIRNVVPTTKPVLRMLWSILLLVSSAYFVFTAQGAFRKYFQYPVATVITRRYVDNITYPAVSICPNNKFSRAKVMMQDDDPEFQAKGLNLSACGATRNVREKMDNMPCGLAMICCCTYIGYNYSARLVHNCSETRRSDLQEALWRAAVNFNMDDFIRYFGQDLDKMFANFTMCSFGLSEYCNSYDFSPVVTGYGLCYTYNSGKNNRSLQISSSSGVSAGLVVALSANLEDETIGTFSQGFSVSIHDPGEFFEPWDGYNVAPGTLATLLLAEQRFENLESPYSTKCKTLQLKSYSTYTTKGCIKECLNERALKECHCRPAGYGGAKNERGCQYQHVDCLAPILADYSKCDCPNPCFETKYKVEISYAQFPDVWTSKLFAEYGNTVKQKYALFLFLFYFLFTFPFKVVLHSRITKVLEFGSVS